MKSLQTTLFVLDALNLDITLHFNVLEAVIAEAVGEAHHCAVGKFDIKLFIVEAERHLLERQTEKRPEISSNRFQVGYNIVTGRGFSKANDSIFPSTTVMLNILKSSKMMSSDREVASRLLIPCS